VTTDIIDKSAGNGITAQSDLEDNEEVWGVILELSDELSHRLEKSGKRASAVSIVIKDNTLAVKQWQRPLECSTKSGFAIARQAFSLFCDSYTWSKPVRAVTVRVINLETDCEPSQINLFVTPEKRENRKNETLVGALEGIRERFGMSAVKNARVLNNNKMPGLNIPNTLPRGVRG
jgi:DNA polymerase-4